ncbi:MAG: pilus assembly protein PilM [bacterium]
MAKSNNIIGLDIAPDFIRAVELEREGSGYRLVEVGMTPTPDGALENGHIENPRAVGRSVRELFRQRKFSSRRVHVALRGSGTMARILSLPSMRSQQLKKVVESEVNRYIVFGDETRVMYYHPIEEYDDEDRRKLNVLLVVAQRELCDSYCRVLKEARLDIESIDISPFCAIRVIRNSAQELATYNSMSLIFDHSGVAMNIFHGDTIRFLRTVHFPKDELLPDTNGFLDRLTTEILMAIHYYENEYQRGEYISRVNLTLGGRADRDMHSHLKAHLADIPVDLHAPFSNIRVDADSFPPDLLGQIDYSFITAVGLAMRDQEQNPLPFQVNLLPEEVVESRQLLRGTKYFLLALLIGFAWLALYLTSIQNSTNKEKEAMKFEEARSADLNLLLGQASKKSIDALKLEQLTLTTGVQHTRNWASLLEEIKKVIPQDAQMTRLTITEPGKIHMEGFAESNPAIHDFLQSLERSNVFYAQELGPRSNENISGHRMVRFTIRASFQLP